MIPNQPRKSGPITFDCEFYIKLAVESVIAWNNRLSTLPPNRLLWGVTPREGYTPLFDFGTIVCHAEMIVLVIVCALVLHIVQVMTKPFAVWERRCLGEEVFGRGGVWERRCF